MVHAVVQLIQVLMSKCQTAALWRRFIKNDLDIMRFRNNEVNFEAAFDYHQNTSNVHKIYVFK